MLKVYAKNANTKCFQLRQKNVSDSVHMLKRTKADVKVYYQCISVLVQTVTKKYIKSEDFGSVNSCFTKKYHLVIF